jgi:ketosteroid isomerase-like protein
MTDSRLDLLRRSYAAFSASDPDAQVAVWHPDCEWDMGPNVLSEAVFRGHDGLRSFIAETTSLADRVEAEILEVRGHGEDVLIRGVNRFRAYERTVTNQPFGQVCEFRDGLIFRVTQTHDPPPGWEEATPIE